MNVNLQMNYWPTYSTNMAECAEPLIDYIDALREPGRVTAAIYAEFPVPKVKKMDSWHIHRTIRLDGHVLDGTLVGDGHRLQYRGSYRIAGIIMNILEILLT